MPSLSRLCWTLLWLTASQRVREGRWENRNQNQNQTKTKATPPQQTHSKKITTGATIEATDNQPNQSTHWLINPLIQTHWSTDPNPPSTDPNPLIQTQHVDPCRSNLQNPKLSTSVRFEGERCERGNEEGGAVTCERQREEVRVRMRENSWENKILFLVLQLWYIAILKVELHCSSFAKNICNTYLLQVQM